MADVSSIAEASGMIAHTTAKREWLGWFGAMAWLYTMANAYQNRPDGYGGGSVYWADLMFLAVFALSLVLVGLRFGQDPKGLTGLAFHATPAAIGITAVLSLLPLPQLPGLALYVLSPIFMAPALARRAYGIVRAADPGYMRTTYMSGAAAAGAALWIINIVFGSPEGPARMAAAFFAFLAWFGARRPIGFAAPAPGPAMRGLSRPLLLGIAAAIFLTFWLLMMKDCIDSSIEQAVETWRLPVYGLLPSACYLLFGFIGDKGYEKGCVVCGAALYLITLQIAFLAGDPQNAISAPLAVANRFFGAYIEYFVLVIPIYFFLSAKRPVFAASMGVGACLLSLVFVRGATPLLPETLGVAGAPLFVSTIISALGFLMLMNFIFERHQEKTLAAALHAFLQDERGRAEAVAPIADGGFQASAAPTCLPAASMQAQAPAQLQAPAILKNQAGRPATQAQATTQAQAPALRVPGFSEQERDIALLLVEGRERGDILRKLHLTDAEAGRLEEAIRKKIQRMGEPDPVIAGAIEKYRLTRRESEILRLLLRGRTNPEIAAELFISEATAKFHARNLLTKLGIETRHRLSDWAAEAGAEDSDDAR